MTRAHFVFRRSPGFPCGRSISASIQAKEIRLRKALGAILANIKLIVASFDRDDLSAILASHRVPNRERDLVVAMNLAGTLELAGARPDIPMD